MKTNEPYEKPARRLQCWIRHSAARDQLVKPAVFTCGNPREDIGKSWENHLKPKGDPFTSADLFRVGS